MRERKAGSLLITKFTLIAALVFTTLFMAACSNLPFRNPTANRDISIQRQINDLARQNRWLEIVDLHRDFLRNNPRNSAFARGLANAQTNAAQHYGSYARSLASQGKLQAALNQVEQGLLAKPRHPNLSQLKQRIIRELESNRLIEQGERSFLAGNDAQARQLVNKASYLRPEDRRTGRIKRLATGINRVQSNKMSLQELRPTNSNNLDLSFNETAIEDIVDFIAEPFGINILLEEMAVEPINLFASGVSFDQAIELVAHAAKAEYEVVGPYTLILRPKGAPEDKKETDLYVRLFNLRSIPAKLMAENLTASLGLEGIVVNERTNAVQVKASAEMLKTVERIIEANDQEVGEAVLQVEIVEVSRSASERLGLDLGSQISASIPQFKIGDATGGGFLETVVPTGLVSIPAATFRYFKQRVNARVLANPSLRAIDDKPAKIHVGDRIPLRTSTTQESNGQSKTNFEYRDIGITLDVTPNIRLDNSVELIVKLEISSLGQNLGTPDTPAYAIGTRNVETSMLLRNNEIAVMGGLIRDEERRTRQSIPGLGTSSSVGKLFTQKDDQNSRTDIYLTIRPLVIRPQGLAPRSNNMIAVSRVKEPLPSLQFAAGKRPTIRIGKREEDVFEQNEKQKSSGNSYQAGKMPSLRSGDFGNTDGEQNGFGSNQFGSNQFGTNPFGNEASGLGGNPNSGQDDFSNQSNTGQTVSGQISFDAQGYDGTKGETLRVALLASNLQTGGREERLIMRFDSRTLSVVGMHTGRLERGNISTRSRGNEIEISLRNGVQLSSGRLIEIEFMPKRNGQKQLSFEAVTNSVIDGEKVYVWIQ